MRLKGQFLLFAAIIIVLTIISFKALIITTRSIPIQEGTFPDRVLKNLQDEYKNIERIAISRPSPIIDVTNYLSNFTKSVRMFEDVEVLWIVFYTNSTSQPINVSIGNYLKTKIILNLSVVGATPTFTSVTLGDGDTQLLSLTPTSNNVNITINYIMRGEERKERVSIDIDEKTLYGFFDIKVKTDNFEARNVNFYKAKFIIT